MKYPNLESLRQYRLPKWTPLACLRKFKEIFQENIRCIFMKKQIKNVKIRPRNFSDVSGLYK